jgi:hypothetical protein
MPARSRSRGREAPGLGEFDDAVILKTFDMFPYASLIANASHPTRCHGSVSICGVGAGAL